MIEESKEDKLQVKLNKVVKRAINGSKIRYKVIIRERDKTTNKKYCY